MFDGDAESLLVRTVTGDVCILPRHINYVTALGMGEAKIVTNGETRRAACIGGMLSVTGDVVRLVPTTFEWAENIDDARARRAEEEAKEMAKVVRDGRLQPRAGHRRGETPPRPRETQRGGAKN